MSETNPIPKRIAVKFFVRSADSADSEGEVALEPFIGMFHRFIQEQAVLGLLVDVADYAHVPQGPGVILIGHDVDYAVDSTAGEVGLLTTRKHYALEQESIAAVMRDTLVKAIVAMRAIEEDGAAALRFDTSRLEIQILDRLAVSRDGGIDSFAAAITPVLQELLEKVDTAVASGDARRPPTLLVTTPQDVGAVELCDRLHVSMPIREIAVEAPALEPGFEIAVESLKELRDAGSDFLLIDVREPDEYEICNLGGQLIPLGTLADRITELDKSAHVIVHCKGGGRGAKATTTLRQAGFENAWNLTGGILAWIDQVDPSLTSY